MKPLDTLNKGPSRILIREQDLEMYKEHRQRLASIQPVNKLGNGSHIHQINDSNTSFIENQRRLSIQTENLKLSRKIQQIMERKSYSTKNGVRMFTRPFWQPKTARLKEMKSSKLNFQLNQDQSKIMFNQRQEKYSQILKENKRILQTLTISGPFVPTIDEELKQREKNLHKLLKLRQINHPQNQCFDRASEKIVNKVSPKNSKQILYQTAYDSRVKYDEANTINESYQIPRQVIQSQLMQNELHKRSTSKQLFSDPQQFNQTDMGNPFTTRSQSIGTDGIQTTNAFNKKKLSLKPIPSKTSSKQNIYKIFNNSQSSISKNETNSLQPPIPNFVVNDQTKKENYEGTFDGISKTNRTSIFQSFIQLDMYDYPLLLELQRDVYTPNKVFIVIQNPKIQADLKEFNISFKQATSLLLKCKHDFRLMIRELLTVKHGQIALKNMAFDTLKPKYIKQINYNSSKILQDFDQKQIKKLSPSKGETFIDFNLKEYEETPVIMGSIILRSESSQLQLVEEQFEKNTTEEDQDQRRQQVFPKFFEDSDHMDIQELKIGLNWNQAYTNQQSSKTLQDGDQSSEQKCIETDRPRFQLSSHESKQLGISHTPDDEMDLNSDTE